MSPAAVADLLEAFVRSHEGPAFMMTADPPLKDWDQVPGDTVAAGAILDRFLHNVKVIALQGRSYRMHNQKELGSTQTNQALTGYTNGDII